MKIGFEDDTYGGEGGGGGGGGAVDAATSADGFEIAFRTGGAGAGRDLASASVFGDLLTTGVDGGGGNGASRPKVIGRRLSARNFSSSFFSDKTSSSRRVKASIVRVAMISGSRAMRAEFELGDLEVGSTRLN